MKKVLHNFVYQASYQVLLIVLPIITIPVISRALGVSGVGTYNYVTSIVNYFVLVAGLGLANYGVREVAVVRDDKEKLSKKFWELQIFNFTFSILAFISFCLFSLTREESVIYLTQSLVVLGAVFDITWFFSGIEDFKKITIRNFVIKILTFIAIISSIKNQNDLIKYFVIQGMGTFLGSISLWWNLKEYIDFKAIRFISIKDITFHFFPALSYFIAKIAISLYQNLTKTILGIVVNMAAVGLYSNAMSLITMSGAIINALNVVMIPKMSNLANKKEKKDIIPILEKTVHLQIFITIGMAFGIASIANTLVPWFFGESFLRLKIILPAISPVLVFQSFQMSIATQYLIPMGYIKEYNYSVIVGALFSVVTTFILSMYIDVFGAVIGILLGYFIICLLRGYKLVKFSSFHFFWSDIIKYILTGFVMWIITFSMGFFLPSTIFGTLIQVIMGSIVFMVIATFLKANPAMNIIKAFLKRDSLN
ncbi:oligosaccharide flippase family protein [Enterococcus dispar]|uniref:oligosaccharide flippase family protein n=1 Tax=Enterococcus dispar TaxID=44009 RepID=UPI00288FFDFE|nr:oligosaccharide flippase family protein [Enterococcus dispar]MDT2706160.1 oligosaccharide flippase family protein [Enterococcus dispar]